MNFIWANNTPSKNQRPWEKKKKTTTPDLRSHLFRCWPLLPMLSKRFPWHTAYCFYPWLAPEWGKENPYCSRHYVYQKPWDEADLNVSSLRSNFHGTRRWHSSFQRREVTNSPAQLWHHNHTKNQHGKITLQVHSAHISCHIHINNQHGKIALQVHSAHISCWQPSSLRGLRTC